MKKNIGIILLIEVFLFMSMCLYANYGHDNTIKTGQNDSLEIFINGWEYSFQQVSNGHPFVFSKIWKYGIINSDLGIRKNFLMNYDIYQDVLLIQIFRNNKPHHIVLNPEYINSFQIDDHLFFNPLKSEEFHKNELNGYYELVYDSKIKFFLKRIKKYSEGDAMEGSSYNPDLEKYIYVDGQTHKIKNKRSFYRIFPDHKKNISKYLRRNQILIKSNDLTGTLDFLRYLEKMIADE